MQHKLICFELWYQEPILNTTKNIEIENLMGSIVPSWISLKIKPKGLGSGRTRSDAVCLTSLNTARYDSLLWERVPRCVWHPCQATVGMHAESLCILNLFYHSIDGEIPITIARPRCVHRANIDHVSLHLASHNTGYKVTSYSPW